MIFHHEVLSVQPWYVRQLIGTIVSTYVQASIFTAKEFVNTTLAFQMGTFAVQNDWTLRPVLTGLDEFFKQLLAFFADSRGQPSLEQLTVYMRNNLNQVRSTWVPNRLVFFTTSLVFLF